MARLVFDLDGTLIDSAPDIHGIANALLAEEGAHPITLQDTRAFVGNGASVFVDRMRAARGLSDRDHARLLADFIARYDTAVTLTHPYPGVIDALEALAQAGHHMGICTNKPLQPCRAVLKHLNLERFFATIWGGDSLAVHKPDPAPLVAAFDALPGGARLFVGDSEVDAETAQRAQVPFLLFTQGYRKTPVADLPHQAHFSDFTALPQLVAQALPARLEI